MEVGRHSLTFRVAPPPLGSASPSCHSVISVLTNLPASSYGGGALGKTHLNLQVHLSLMVIQCIAPPCLVYLFPDLILPLPVDVHCYDRLDLNQFGIIY
jgi:hypothetical protein